MANGKESPKKKLVFSSNKRAFGLLFENHPSPMFIYDIESLAFLDVNDAGVEKFGYSRDELKLLTLMDVLSAEDKNRLLDDLKKERRISLLHTDTWQVFLKGGGLREVETTSHTLAYDGHDAVLVLVRDIAAKSDALVVTEVELRALFASMRDAVFVIDDHGVYRKIAPTNPDLLLLPPQELIGRNLRDFFSPEQAESFLTAIHQVLETQQSVRVEYSLMIGESLKWFGTSISPMDADSTLWVASDITERKQADAARLESEERFRSLFDHMMDGVYRSTHAGKFVDINPAMIKMFGYSSREEMLAVDIKKELYFAPEERGSHVLDTGQEEVEAYRMRRKDGSEIWVEDHGSYVHDDDGGVQYHEGILRDITARKRAEESLLKLNKAVDTSTEAIFLTDTQGVFTYVNPGFTALYGFTAEEVIGKATPRIFKSGLLSEQVYVDFWGRLTTKQEVRGELQNKRKDGKIIYIEGSATPVVDDGGQIIGYLGIQRDVTERKLADEALRDSEASLQAVLRSTADGILAVNRENKVLYTNERFAEMWLIPQSVMASKDDFTLLQYILDQLIDPQGFLQMVQELYKSDKESFDTLYFKNGRVFERSSRPMQQGKNMQGRVWSFRDITERKLAEEALHKAEANFRSIFENATVGIYQSTPQGRFLRVNQVMASIFGYQSPQDMVDSIVSIDKQYYVEPGVRQEFKRLMAEQGQANEFTSLNYRKDGSHFHIQESARAVKDAQGNIQYYEGFVSDITERKHVEESLRESESRFRYMADTTPVMVWMAGEDSLCNYFNKRWLDFTGRTMEQELGNGWIGGVHPDDLERCLHNYQDAFRVRREFKMEYRLHSADGTYRWLLDHGVPRFSTEGEFFGFIGSCVDISDFKQAEDELNRANVSLTIAHRDLEKSLLHEQVLARTDGLTGLYNYRYFFELATYEFEASKRYQRPLSIIIFDTDHLKQVNDTLGHLAGDRMLITVAQTAAAHIRNVDSLARYGGDEFVILLPQTSEEMAFSIAERIRENVAALCMETEKGPLSVTLSLGVAGMSRDSVDESIEQVVQRADKALYTAKQAGRNRTELFTAE